MTIREGYNDRQGKSKLMKKRTIRVTEEENKAIDELLEIKGKTLRDVITDLVFEEIDRLKY
ncbi:hypothetical protein GCM10008904_32450 [Paraclostridium ghonii]|uniref:CopG family transcriptional regulator n=1 Tax=Paraclostridium ghonii TaxID=29358 RepID=A0ABU0MWV6_9FIRM|nr:hypothetical protein [Paeniclostridium ghonii]MDQ0555350.1 hypothetical protein [Paeniclostridium ghonii]